MMNALLLSFGIIFLAEIGDKSQLMALAFATRYRALTILIAVTVATLVVHAGSVVGAAFALALPAAAVQLAAGLAFIGFATWTLRGDGLGEDDTNRAGRSGRWALVTIGSAFFLAELGDKTMLATITPATTEEPRGTWLGSSLGMVAADAIAQGIGLLQPLTGQPRFQRPDAKFRGPDASETPSPDRSCEQVRSDRDPSIAGQK